MSNNSSAASPTTSRIARWPSWLLAAARILVGLFFASAGLPKLIQHASYVPSFEHWQVPFPGLSVFAVGLLETIGGILLVVGVAAVPVAALLLVDMLAAFGFAGTKDGGQYIVLPLLLGIFCALFTLRGGGAWQLWARVPPLFHRSGKTTAQL
ncbi:MAG: DoxX family membrane protein [Candidatus Dormibacteraeota bacterium]|uniref:DoxX family membrane protein n=1 Tax=Candidatus Dormiibacter inghamiae TaxID=3127013 RepID=A0A934KE62_9BACT|nr:DoxX family membrane protein [Candidatus Dormibacteraeota bacterium]MBJ7606289.1 DoxX family membrane protein [Candidatus Dormibacteraeota bacterium]